MKKFLFKIPLGLLLLLNSILFAQQNQALNQNMPEEENDVLLNINLTFDSNEYGAYMVIYDENGYITNASGEENPVTLNLPEGTYDIFTVFYNDFEAVHYVIKELVNVSANSTINIDFADATNYVSVNTYDENGLSLLPGVLDPDSGNHSSMMYDRSIYFSPTNSRIYTNTYFYDDPIDGENSTKDFYINNISDRYSVLHAIAGIGYAGGNYFLKSELKGVNGATTIENNPEDWTYHEENLRPGNSGLTGDFYPSFFCYRTINEEQPTFGAYIENMSNPTIGPEEVLKIYLNNPLDDNPLDFIVYPMLKEDTGSFTYNNIMGNAILKEGNNVRYGSGITFQGSFYYTENGRLILPFNSRFSFLSSNDVIQGNSCPISSLSFLDNPLPNYIGRYGEIRQSDFFSTTVEIIRNSNIEFSGTLLDLGSYTIPETGNFEVTYTNTNINVEGLAGKNITRMLFDKANEDFASPTLQHLQFRNIDNQVTDHFSSVSEGTVRLAAGDFQYNLDDGYYDYVEGNTVEFYYSPYDQNNWTELELTEYPEYFQMPAFGDYYEASLASVIVPEDNTWFDVRIICTDAAGNKQEQVISPAFKIEQATMGIQEVNQSSFTVYPNPFTNEINVQLPDNLKGSYTFKVSDLTGKTIYAQSQNDKSFVWNGSSLPKGVYILSIENSGKVIAQKVIKK